MKAIRFLVISTVVALVVASYCAVLLFAASVWLDYSQGKGTSDGGRRQLAANRSQPRSGQDTMASLNHGSQQARASGHQTHATPGSFVQPMAKAGESGQQNAFETGVVSDLAPFAPLNFESSANGDIGGPLAFLDSPLVGFNDADRFPVPAVEPNEPRPTPAPPESSIPDTGSASTSDPAIVASAPTVSSQDAPQESPATLPDSPQAKGGGFLGLFAHVKPWQRGRLADPIMRADRDPLGVGQDEHVFFSREAASGGRGVGGGGCGCN